MPRGTKISLGDTSKPEHRVLRLGNFHVGATDADLRSFFEGFDMVDWKRDTNAKSGRNTIAYVLMGSMHEVFRAERELDAKELNGRPVRIMRAKSGFVLTKEGMLNEREVEKKPSSELRPVLMLRTGMVAEPTTEIAPKTPAPRPEGFNIEAVVKPDMTPAPASSPTPPQLQAQPQSQRHAKEEQAQVTEALPSLSEPNYNPVTARGATHPMDGTPITPVTPPRRNKLNSSVEPSNRVLLINGLHHEANFTSIKLFFTNYTVRDFLPRHNAKTGRPMGFGFVMLGSMEERNHALQELQGRSLMGKVVELEVANKAVKVTEDGFLDGGLGDTPGWSGKRGEEFWAGNMPSKSKVLQCAESNVVHSTPTKAADAKQVEGDQDTISTVPAVSTPYHHQKDVHVAREPFWPSNGWNGPKSVPSGQTLPTWDINVAHRMLKPWNLVGNDSKDKTTNLVTEDDWYYFQPKELARYKSRKSNLV